MLTRGLTAKTRTGFQPWRAPPMTEPPPPLRMLLSRHTRRADPGPSSLASHPRGLVGPHFDLPAQLHDSVRGNAEELGRIQGEVAQEDEQPIPPCQKIE